MSREDRDRLRAVLRRVSALERVRKCGLVPVGSGGIAVRLKDGVASYSGLATCGSMLCPVCGSKILSARASQISSAAGAWDLAGHSAVLITLTLRHDVSMPLADLISALAGGYRAITRGRPWRRLADQIKMAGTIRSLEVTWSRRHGWHPHLHILMFLRGRPGDDAVAALKAYLRPAWSRVVTEAGYPGPDSVRGVDVRLCHDPSGAGRYIAKPGWPRGSENASPDLMHRQDGTMTSMDLLAEYDRIRDPALLELWHELEAAMRGRKVITWSRGLRGEIAALGPAPDERTDEEIASGGTGREQVIPISRDQWTRITAVPGLPAEILQIAGTSGAAGIAALLAFHGITAALPESPGRPPP